MAFYRWINSDRIKRQKQRREIDGLAIDLELSPYHTPQSISGQYSSQTGMFSIRFEYIDDEPAKGDIDMNGVWITEGRHTGKLLAIRLPVDEPPLKDACIIDLHTRVRARVHDALKLRGNRLHGKFDQELNQAAAVEAIDDNLGELLSKG